MNASTLQYVMREPVVASTGGPPPLLVLLHGVRSNEQDLMGLASQLDGRFRIVSARAPIEMGPGAFGWYHVQFVPEGFIINEEEAEQSRQKVLRFLGELPGLCDYDPSRVFLMGFSQGCIMSLGAALSAPSKFAGVVGMSGRMLESLRAAIAPAEELKGLPVLVVHGTQDSVIGIEYGREIRDELGRLPVDLTYREYNMGHHVSRESMGDIATWLTARLDLAASGQSSGA